MYQKKSSLKNIYYAQCMYGKTQQRYIAFTKKILNNFDKIKTKQSQKYKMATNKNVLGMSLDLLSRCVTDDRMSRGCQFHGFRFSIKDSLVTLIEGHPRKNTSSRDMVLHCHITTTPQQTSSKSVQIYAPVNHNV